MIQEKILKFLIENNEEISINKLSKEINSDYKLVHTNIKKLENKKLINTMKFGNAYKIKLNLKLSPEIFNAEYQRRENVLKNSNLNIIYKKLREINIPFIVLLFGSFAKGKSNNKSDIDLLIITEHENIIEDELKLIPLNIHSTYVNYEEFSKMVLSNEFSVVKEVIKKNIILINICEYYRIIENARERAN